MTGLQLLFMVAVVAEMIKAAAPGSPLAKAGALPPAAPQNGLKGASCRPAALLPSAEGTGL